MDIRNRHSRIAIVGFGNVLLKDEGVGVHVVNALFEVMGNSSPNLDIIDGGTSPDTLLMLEGLQKLILIDAVKGNGLPGTVYRFHPEDIEPELENIMSLHQVNLQHGLAMMELSGTKPDNVVIIGVEPKEIDWGLELSQEIQSNLPRIVKAVLDEISILDKN